MADPQQAGEALANPVVGIDEEHAERSRRRSRVGHGRSVGSPTPSSTATDVEIGLRHSAEPRIVASVSPLADRDSAAARSTTSGGTVTSIVVPSPRRDTTANALWEIGYDKGSHPNPVLAGDTLYAASRVIEKQDRDEQTGIVGFNLVGVKNETPVALIERGINLFEDKFEQKVFEIERTVLLPMRTVTRSQL